MGYLNWGAEQPLALHLVWTAYIAAVPLYALRGLALTLTLALTLAR